MRCAPALEMMSRSLDGPLPDAEQARLDGHLRDCPGCAETWRCMREGWAAVRALPPAVPPPGLAARARAAALQQAPVAREGPEGFLAGLFPVAWRFAVASWVPALALGLVAALAAGPVDSSPVDVAVVASVLRPDVGRMVLGGAVP
jgi:anti-sigma factor RsiW